MGGSTPAAINGATAKSRTQLGTSVRSRSMSATTPSANTTEKRTIACSSDAHAAIIAPSPRNVRHATATAARPNSSSISG
jgi:hypothetical protein